MAATGGRPTRGGALRSLDLPRTTALEALARLANVGHLGHDGAGTWCFVDPLFGAWVAAGRPSE